jgi:hypothetical protein
MKKVKLIRQEGEAALVQHMHLRVTIPSGELVNGHCSEEALAAGIPWGEPWDEIVSISLKPEMVAARLRRLGAWTWDDLLENPLKARQAFVSALGNDIQNFMRKLKEIKNGKR